MGDVQVAYSVIPFNSHKQFILSIQIEIVTIHHQFLVAQGVIRYNSLYREAPPKGVHQRVGNSQVELCESVGKSII